MIPASTARRFLGVLVLAAASAADVRSQVTATDTAITVGPGQMLAVYGIDLRLDQNTLQRRFPSLAGQTALVDTARARMWAALSQASFNAVRTIIIVSDTVAGAATLSSALVWAAERQVLFMPLLSPGATFDALYPQRVAAVIRGAVRKLGAANQLAAHESLLAFQLSPPFGMSVLRYDDPSLANAKAIMLAAVDSARSADSATLLEIDPSMSPKGVALRASFDAALARAGAIGSPSLDPTAFANAIATVTRNIGDVASKDVVQIIDLAWFAGTLSPGSPVSFPDLLRDISASLAALQLTKELMITTGFDAAHDSSFVEAVANVSDYRLGEGESPLVLGIFIDEAVDFDSPSTIQARAQVLAAAVGAQLTPAAAGWLGQRSGHAGVLSVADTVVPRAGLDALISLSFGMASSQESLTTNRATQDSWVVEEPETFSGVVRAMRNLVADLLLKVLHAAVQYASQRLTAAIVGGGIPEPQPQEVVETLIEDQDDFDALPQIEIQTQPLRSGGGSEIRLVLRNPHPRPLRGMTAAVTVDGERLAVPVIDVINPGVRRTVRLGVQGRQVAPNQVAVRLEKRSRSGSPRVVQVTGSGPAGVVRAVGPSSVDRTRGISTPRRVDGASRIDFVVAADSLATRPIPGTNDKLVAVRFTIRNLSPSTQSGHITGFLRAESDDRFLHRISENVTIRSGVSVRKLWGWYRVPDSRRYSFVVGISETGDVTPANNRASMMITPTRLTAQPDVAVSPADISVSTSQNVQGQPQLNVTARIRNVGSAPTTDGDVAIAVVPIGVNSLTGALRLFRVPPIQPGQAASVAWVTLAPRTAQYGVRVSARATGDEQHQNDYAARRFLSAAVGAPDIAIANEDLHVKYGASDLAGRRRVAITAHVRNVGNAGVENANIRFVVRRSGGGEAGQLTQNVTLDPGERRRVEVATGYLVPGDYIIEVRSRVAGDTNRNNDGAAVTARVQQAGGINGQPPPPQNAPDLAVAPAAIKTAEGELLKGRRPLRVQVHIANLGGRPDQSEILFIVRRGANNLDRSAQPLDWTKPGPQIAQWTSRPLPPGKYTLMIIVRARGETASENNHAERQFEIRP